MQHCFDVRDSAAGGLGCKAPYQVNRERRAGCTDGEWNQRGAERMRMHEADQLVAQLVSRRQRAPKRDRHRTAEQPDQQRARQLPPALLVRAQKVAQLAPDDLRGRNGLLRPRTVRRHSPILSAPAAPDSLTIRHTTPAYDDGPT